MKQDNLEVDIFWLEKKKKILTLKINVISCNSRQVSNIYEINGHLHD